MTLPVKIGISTLTVGAITGAGYAGSTYFINGQQGTTIKDLINKEYKHILLSTVAGNSNTDKEHWQKIWTSYQEESQKHATDIFGLTGWNKEKPTDLTETLKNKCEELKSKNISNTKDPNYQNVIKYCARSVTVKDQAIKERLTVINTKGEDSVWSEIAGRSSNLTEHFSNLKITASAGGAITADDIKGGCEKAIAKNKSENDYETVYKSYKEVCTKPK